MTMIHQLFGETVEQEMAAAGFGANLMASGSDPNAAWVGCFTKGDLRDGKPALMPVVAAWRELAGCSTADAVVALAKKRAKFAIAGYAELADRS